MKNITKFLLVSFSITTLTLFVFTTSPSTPNETSSGDLLDSFFQDAVATFGDGTGVFGDWQSWPNSANYKEGDTLHDALLLLYNGTTGKQTTTDFNGDGLIDVLYHDNYVKEWAILLNTGNMGFDLVYKCKYYQNGATILWYGDCADV